MAVLVVAVVALTAPDSTDKQSGSGSSPASQNSQARSTPVPSSASRTPTPSATAPSGSLSLGGSSSRSKSSDGGDASDSSANAKDVPLVVLNNTTTSGLASRASNDFKDGGWKVTSVGNLSNNILSTCAYYDPDVAGAKAAAKALQSQFSGIKRVAEKFSNLPSGPIVVVLTPDYDSN